MGNSLGSCDFVPDHPLITGRSSAPTPCGEPATIVLSGLVHGRRCLLHATAAGTEPVPSGDARARHAHPVYASPEGGAASAPRHDLRAP
jgi:hypothetical protein